MLPRLVVSLLTLLTLPFVLGQRTNAVTGLTVSSGSSVPLRKNINELQSTGGAQWDLYIRALSEMQKVTDTNAASYFQVMGIHGKPYIEWNGGGKRAGNGWAGYCPHGEKLFLPWHRPFIVLYEQILVDHAKRLASQYPQRYRDQYTRAAASLRSPFWDWGTSPTVPAATVPKKIKVNVPDGSGLKQVEIDNPLNTYKFPKAALDGKYGSFDSQRRSQIYRCPSPDSYPGSANANLADRPYKQWIYDCFTHAKDFSDFASTGTSGISLEQIHNGIHWDGACGSQFLAADFSGYDPLFMLHHTNIDRLWAYWQAIWPKHSRFNTPYPGGARYSTPGGTTIGPDSPLNPFRRADGSYHTTKTVNDIRTFGYSYTGLEYWSKSAAQMKADATSLINRLYGPADVQRRQLAERDENATTTRYFANIEVDLEQLDRPCLVELYVDGQKAGDLVAMEQPATGILHGGFTLDNVIEDSSLAPESPNKIVKSVTRKVEVSIVKQNGDRIPIDDVPGLKVDIEDVLVTLPETITELPEFTDSHILSVPKDVIQGLVDLL